MDLLARLRPRWRHPDPAVRAAAVHDMGTADQERLATIAGEDPDARVRRAAIERLDDPEVLERLEQREADPALRELAAERCREANVRIASSGAAIAECQTALGRIADARALAAVAIGATHDAVRRAALARVSGDRALRDVVRNAGDSAIRREALERIHDEAVLRSIAVGDGPRELAARAVERIDDVASLQAIVASRTAAKSIRERARERLAARSGPGSTVSSREARARQLELSTAVHSLRTMRDVEQAALRVRAAQREWEQLARLAEPRPDVAEQFAAACEVVLRDANSVARRQAELDRERAAHDDALAARTALCERIEALEGPEADRALADARSTWATLPSLSGPRAAALQERFARACERAGERHGAWRSAATLHADLAGLIAEAEALAEGPRSPAAKTWRALEQRWDARIRGAHEIDPLAQRFAAARRRVEQRMRESEEERAALEQKTLRHVDALCTRVQEMLRADALKASAGRRELETVRQTLGTLGPLPSSERRAEWINRLTELRDELLRRLARDEETEEWRRWANVAAQEELIARVERLLESNDLAEGTRQLGRLQEEWAQVATASPDKSQALWERFRNARNELRKRCDAYQAANLEQKRALCAEAAAVADSTAWNETPEVIRRLQARWKEIGPAPVRHATALWREFREPLDRFFARRKEHFDRLDGERRENAKVKLALCERAEALADSTDWDETATVIKQLQADWKKSGPPPRQESEALWQRFRAACDRFFDRRNRREELAREEALGTAQAICDEVESLAAALSGDDAPDSDRIGSQLDDAWGRWLRLEVAMLDGAQEVGARLLAACERIAGARPESLRGTRLDPDTTRARREKLCLRLEALAPAEPEPPRSLSPQEMALALRERLAANTIGGADTDARPRDVQRDVERISMSWANLGPVLGEDAHALGERFARALARLREATR